jgi:TPR repeat protein
MGGSRVILAAFLVLLAACKSPTQKCASGDLEACKTTCAQGDAQGCFGASAMYLLGSHGAPQDDAQAVQYKDRACTLGDLTSCEELGVFYKNGFHAPKDPGKARPFLKKACDGGVQTACDSLKDLR